MMNKYVSKVGYYGLKTLDGRIKDPETRITDDVDTFATSVTQLQNDLFVPVLKILVFGANVAVNFGQTGSLQFGYIFCSALLFMGIMPDYRKIQKDKRKVSLSIKALEEQESKEAVKKYGSTDSGAKLADILGPILKKKKPKAKK